ncbi:FliI/YscN family ATPase [Sinorhizobium psoraleae]|uniref:FliI/YscN family ATPase n=1 Tax=Sinorhizobium psoraleae TaxID=520838 RepID=A0ABT4KRJ2_9HYPH|nr:FliI/YscN family ATPase [Sinorhizobium psoraleae]MCZ4093507.1 FliI/YscN family ATPase [Sinorhizobium psoraleae]
MVDGLLRLESDMARAETRRASGRVIGVSGLLVRAQLPAVRIGELCELREPGHGRLGFADVVGVEGESALLSLHGDTRGVSVRTEVVPSGHQPFIVTGDFLIGAIIDAHGNILRKAEVGTGGTARFSQSLHAPPPDILSRRPIDRRFPVGIPAVDGLLTCGEGQRIGIFGSPGVGKSTLIGDIIKNSDGDIIVCALVGERGREVGEFVDRVMPAGKPSNAVLVVATSDRPALERYKAVLTATAVAEHFRDRGKRVLLIVDSVTRMARALREVGLAAGEPPVRRGFPPSVFAALPQVFERAGNSATGTMTAFYTVLIEGAEQDDPIAEETRALLDGHVVLSDRIAQNGHFPAVDVLASRSRTMYAVVDESHNQAANHLRSLLALYKEVELLIRVGEYREGQDPAADEAVRKRGMINKFLYGAKGCRPFEETVTALRELAR